MFRIKNPVVLAFNDRTGSQFMDLHYDMWCSPQQPTPKEEVDFDNAVRNFMGVQRYIAANGQGLLASAFECMLGIPADYSQKVLNVCVGFKESGNRYDSNLPLIFALNAATGELLNPADRDKWFSCDERYSVFHRVARKYLGEPLYRLAITRHLLLQVLHMKLDVPHAYDERLMQKAHVLIQDYGKPNSEPQPEKPNLAKIDAAEAASLQTLLIDFFPDCRPEYPAGLYAWAENALRQQDKELLDHINAARKKIKGRDTYAHTVLSMCYAKLTILRK